MMVKGSIVSLALLGGCDRPLAESVGLIDRQMLLGQSDLPAGASTVSTVTLSVQNAEIVLLEPATVRGQTSMEARIVISETWISPTEVQRVTSEDFVRRTYTFADKNDVEEEHDPLEGVVLIGLRGTDGFTWRLKDGLPSDAQRDALARLSETESYLPDFPVAIGQSWDVSAASLIGGSGGGLAGEDSGSSGTGRVRWVGSGEFAGIPCAELEFVANNLQMLEEGEKDSRVIMDLRGEMCVAMNTGVELRSRTEGWISAGLPRGDAGSDATPTQQFLGTMEIIGDTRISGVADLPSL